MPNKNTKHLAKGGTGQVAQSLQIEGATIKEVELRSESEKTKARRKRINEALRKAGLGNTKRDKKRFIKEE